MNFALKLKAFMDSKYMVFFDYVLALAVIAYGSFNSSFAITACGWIGLALAIYRPSTIADKMVANVVKPKAN